MFVCFESCNIAPPILTSSEQCVLTTMFVWKEKEHKQWPTVSKVDMSNKIVRDNSNEKKESNHNNNKTRTATRI